MSDEAFGRHGGAGFTTDLEGLSVLITGASGGIGSALVEPFASQGRSLATVPLRRVARADEVARRVVMLSAPGLSAHVTGEFISVSGGMEGRLLWP